MKKLINIPNTIILLLVVILVIVLINPKGIVPNRTLLKVDSVPYAVYDTVLVDSLVEVEVEVEVPVPYEVEKRVEVPVIQPVDTTEIMKIYFAKVPHNEILMLPNNQGKITITDTISKNSVVNRKFIADIKKMIVKDTIYTKEPKKSQLFFGFEGGFNKVDVVSHIGTGVIFKTKEDKLYHVGVGVANRLTNETNGDFKPYVNGGVFWKIKVKRQ
jgi:hypothetical protein